jgi:AAT family amino acid transporter/GABA permease
VAVLSCLNSGLYVTSRILRELAAHGDAPAALVRTGARQVPMRAILTGSAFGFLTCIASITSPDLVFAFLLNTSGAVILVIYAMIAFAQIRARQAMHLRGEIPRFAMWGFPWLSYIAIGAMASVLVAMAILPSQRVQVAASLLSVAVVVVACRIHRGRW